MRRFGQGSTSEEETVRSPKSTQRSVRPQKSPETFDGARGAPSHFETLERKTLFAAVAARSADAFVDSIGINTHFSFPGSAYTSPTAQTMLSQLGVRHIRDQIYNAGATTSAALYATSGVQTNIAVDYLGDGVTPYVNALQNAWAESVEGPNEPDLTLRSYGGFTDSGTDVNNDFRATRLFQNNLFTAVNANAATQNKPVLSPAMGFTIHSAFLAGTGFDGEALHYYPPAGINPDYWRLTAAVAPASALIRPAGSTMPTYMTETGYPTGNAAENHVSLAAQRKYLPRTLAEQFNRGVSRTYLYELADEGTSQTDKELSFGILNNNLTTKPSYTALQNMISLLKERTWNATTKQWSALSFTPGSLDYSLTGDTAGVHQLLLQKSSGEFYLMLWNEALSYDGVNDVAVPAKSVNVVFNTPIAGASRYSLDSASALQTYMPTQTISISVPDEVVVLKLTTGASQPTPTFLSLNEAFTTSTLNALPSGWSQLAGDSWQVKEGATPTNRWLENLNVSGSHALTKTLTTTLSGSWSVDLDHTWRWGGSVTTPLWGAHTLSTSVDLLNASSNGYRLKLYQGNDNLPATFDNKLVEIYKVTAGVQGATPLTSGAGFNRPGWEGRGLSTPDWRHVTFSLNAVTHVLSVNADPDGDGVAQQLAQVTDSTYTMFTKLVLGTPELYGTCAPMFDNIIVAAAPTSAEIFQSGPVNGVPTGWTQAAGDNWHVIAGTTPTNQWVQNDDASGNHTLSKTFASALSGSWTFDFDHTWRWGGNIVVPQFGAHNLSVAVDILNGSNSGYRLKVYEGDSGQPGTFGNNLIEIYKVTAGAQGALIGNGGGYNRAGWQSQGQSTPDWRHLTFAFDSATRVFTVNADPDGDGVFQKVAQATDTAVASFTQLKLSTPDLVGTCAPMLDNLFIATVAAPQVSVVATDSLAGESTGDTGRFTFTRTGSTASPLVVSYSLGGSATNGLDYASLPLSITIPAGASSAFINLTPTADATVEGAETATVQILASTAYQVGAARSDTIRITDYVPNLVVTDMTMSLAQPVGGQLLKFSAVVKNAGNAPTLVSSNAVKLLFYVDNESLTWTRWDNVLPVIAPGASITLQANLDGVGNLGQWAATVGEHVVTAWIDTNTQYWNPGGVVAEGSDWDNQYFERIVVAAPAALIAAPIAPTSRRRLPNRLLQEAIGIGQSIFATGRAIRSTLDNDQSEATIAGDILL